MKIAAPPLPAGLPLPLQGHFGENAEHPAQSFADLLAAMLPALQGGEAEDRAADPSPRIGGDGIAFERARLLVDTALEFPRLGHPPAGHRAIDLLRAEVRTVAPQSGAPSPDRPLSTLPQLIAGWAAALEPVSPVVRSAIPAAPPVVAPPSSARVSAMPIAPAPVSTATIGRHTPHVEPRTPPSDRAATHEKPQPAPRHISPFGAHLHAFEGGLRLLLRLPMLAVGERAELETRIAQLFDRFGHRRHAIVIHEIGKGEG